MKLKKILTLGLITVMTASVLVGCNSNKDDHKKDSSQKENSTPDIKIAMITDSEHGNNKFINESAKLGLGRAKDDFDINVKRVNVEKENEMDQKIKDLCEIKPELILGIGDRFGESIKKFAEKYPKQQFAIVDYKYEKQPANVTSIVFDDNVSAYLAGFVAQKMSETGTVGFIGGLEGETRVKNEAGFKAGVLAANESARPVVVKYVDVFSNPESAKTASKEMIENDGVDVIFSATEDDAKGAIEIAKEKSKKAIGFNGDQSKIDENTVLTSTIKNVDIAVYNVVKCIIEEKYDGGQVIDNTLDMKAIGISSNSDKNIPPDVLENVKDLLEKIKDAEIAVPKN